MTKPAVTLDLSCSPLRCPITGSDLQLLDDTEKVSAINAGLKNGDLTLAAGSIPEGKVDAILISSIMQHQYPVIGGVPYLMEDFG